MRIARDDRVLLICVVDTYCSLREFIGLALL
jgi:hypothetical protein